MLDDVLKLTEELEETVSQYLGEECSQQMLNLLRAGIAAHEVAFHFPEVEKEDLLAFLGNCWEGGVEQRKIQSLEKEGMVRGGLGVALSVSSYISVFGERKGILVPEE